MSDADARDPAAQTLRDAVHRTGESLLALLRTRAELAALEFAEERDRARDRLLMVMVAAVAATFALLASLISGTRIDWRQSLRSPRSMRWSPRSRSGG
jgi:uncharacterized membrane protein YqjE